MPHTVALLGLGGLTLDSLSGIRLAHPQLLLVSLICVPILWLAHRRRKALAHPGLTMHSNLRSAPLIAYLPKLFLVGFIILLALALSTPQLPEVASKEVIVTRDFIIATDISGSMSGEVQDPDQVMFTGDQKDENGQPLKVTRRLVAEKAIDAFVKQRKGDRVALFLFDTETYYSWPLSTDLHVIELKNRGSHNFDGGGTDFAGPHGPIPAAIEHFKELGAARSKILIMVTDGEDNISEERLNQLTQQLTALGIRVYTLGIGEDWTRNAECDLAKLTRATGGLVIPVGNASQMKAGFDQINQLEKSNVEIEKKVTYHDIYEYPIAAAVIFILLYLGLAALVREDA